MKLTIANGRLQLLADSPGEGFDLAETVAEARLVGKYLKVHRNNGDVGVSVPLHDEEYARLIRECPEDE